MVSSFYGEDSGSTLKLGDSSLSAIELANGIASLGNNRISIPTGVTFFSFITTLLLLVQESSTPVILISMTDKQINRLPTYAGMYV